MDDSTELLLLLFGSLVTQVNNWISFIVTSYLFNILWPYLNSPLQVLQ